MEQFDNLIYDNISTLKGYSQGKKHHQIKLQRLRKV